MLSGPLDIITGGALVFVHSCNFHNTPGTCWAPRGSSLSRGPPRALLFDGCFLQAEVRLRTFPRPPCCLVQLTAGDLAGNDAKGSSVSSRNPGLCFIPGPILGALKTKATDFLFSSSIIFIPVPIVRPGSGDSPQGLFLLKG